MAYFVLLGQIGVVSSGVVKGLSTALYVILAFFLFYFGLSAEEVHTLHREKYGISVWSALACVLCVAGVVLYAMAADAARTAAPLLEEREGGEQAPDARMTYPASRASVELPARPSAGRGSVPEERRSGGRLPSASRLVGA